MIKKDSSESPTCNIHFTNADWQSIFSVNVKAVTDHIYDGDHTVSLKISKIAMLPTYIIPYGDLTSKVNKMFNKDIL